MELEHFIYNSVPLLLENHFRSFPHQVASVSFLQFTFDGEDTSDMRFRHITEMTILTVQLIVEFSKQLPGFATLQREDQITLLKVHSPAHENGGLMSKFFTGKPNKTLLWETSRLKTFIRLIGENVQNLDKNEPRNLHFR